MTVFSIANLLEMKNIPNPKPRKIHTPKNFHSRKTRPIGSNTEIGFSDLMREKHQFDKKTRQIFGKVKKKQISILEAQMFSISPHPKIK